MKVVNTAYKVELDMGDDGVGFKNADRSSVKIAQMIQKGKRKKRHLFLQLSYKGAFRKKIVFFFSTLS